MIEHGHAEFYIKFPIHRGDTIKKFKIINIIRIDKTYMVPEFQEICHFVLLNYLYRIHDHFIGDILYYAEISWTSHSILALTYTGTKAKHLSCVRKKGDFWVEFELCSHGNQWNNSLRF